MNGLRNRHDGQSKRTVVLHLAEPSQRWALEYFGHRAIGQTTGLLMKSARLRGGNAGDGYRRRPFKWLPKSSSS